MWILRRFIYIGLCSHLELRKYWYTVKVSKINWKPHQLMIVFATHTFYKITIGSASNNTFNPE